MTLQVKTVFAPLLSNPWKAMEIVGRLFLGAIFVYAAWDKILDPAAFAQAIANYQILPPAWINAVAWWLPWMELISGLCLISGRLVAGGALWIALMLIVFMGALAHSAYLGLDIACGCFTLDGSAGDGLYLDMARDAVMLAVALMLLVRRTRRMAATKPAGR